MGEGGYLQINKSLNADAFDEYLSTQQSQLPFLPDVARISPLVTRVLGFNPGKVSNIGVRYSKVGPSHLVGQLSLLALSALTLNEVYTAGNKYLYSRQRIYKNTDRYWPRNPELGSGSLEYPDRTEHRHISGASHTLAWRSHRWCPGSDSLVPSFGHGNLQECTWTRPASYQ